VVTFESNGLNRRTDFNVLGGRRTANNVTVDGVPATDIDNGFALKLAISEDAVAEVQIMLSNYQAEHGRSSGANVQIVTKSGTRDFHGLGSYFKRHEQFNANSFFNNRVGLEKPRYRFNTYTYNIGGPVTIPKLFNRNRDKVFFFWSQEFWPNRQGSTLNTTMPTAAERNGDFSGTLDVNNRLVVIQDPFNNRAPFPGNRIPANRLSPSGRALLNVFDAPNFFDRNISRGAYNYVLAAETNIPKRTDSLKVDLNITPKDQFYATLTTFDEVTEGPVGIPGIGQNAWPQMTTRFAANTKGLAARYLRIISPSIVNEFHFGFFTNPEAHTFSEADLARNQRATIGFTAGRLSPPPDSLDLIPNATFGGVPGAAPLTINGRFPIGDPNKVASWNDKITIIRQRHTWKTGIYIERFWRDISPGVQHRGQYDFGRNVNNPLDTNYAYSNAALGVFNSYTEASRLPRQYSRGGRAEWFVQDNWKVREGLTLDFGMRFYWLPPVHLADDQMAGFVPSRYDPASRVLLIQPGFDSQRRRIGVHPVTGQEYPVNLIGAIAPGIGNPANGMVVAAASPDYPRSLTASRGIQLAPRFGFAWDPFRNGKTAVRGGIGMFYSPLTVNRWVNFVGQPPLVSTPTVFFGEMAQISPSAGVLFPSNVEGFDGDAKVPSVVNYSFSVQRDIGFSTVVDVGYVGSLGRNLSWRRDINPIPLGANFNAANGDPTTPGRPLPPAFLRPTPGYNNILITETASSSSYHSLQVTANRRFARGLEFGLSWTWSKTMDFNNEDGEIVSTLLPLRVRNYGLASFDRTHVVKANWLWQVPKLTSHRLAGFAMNGWQMAGIASFISGQPLPVGFSTVTAVDITGTPSEAARIDITGNPILPKSERTFSRNFRTEVFRLPAVGSVGNAAKTVFRGPGINNWDLALFKDFPIRETMRFQFRWEMYNAFNHTQFSALDATARFELNGTQVNPRFGEFTAARDPRIMQFALRFYF
jgi:hypothetical protein